MNIYRDFEGNTKIEHSKTSSCRFQDGEEAITIKHPEGNSLTILLKPKGVFEIRTNGRAYIVTFEGKIIERP